MISTAKRLPAHDRPEGAKGAFETRRPPAASFGSAVASMRRPLDFFMSNLRRHPQIFRSRLFGFSAYVIHHPDYVRHVLSDNARNYVKFEKYRYLRLIGGNGLVTNEGESWLRQRRLIQPAFNHAALDRAWTVMWQESEAAVRRLGDGAIDLSRPLGELTLAIVARCLFSTCVGEQVEVIRRELDLAQRLGNILLRTPLPLFNAVPYLPVFRRITSAADRLRSIVIDLINARRTSGTQPADLLDALIMAHDQRREEAMSEQQLVDEVVTLLLAGHETTLQALSWTFYLLARHPAAYDRLRSEALQSADSNVGSADSTRMSWAGAVAREALRLYPPAYLIGRTALAEDRLGEYVVPAGTNIMINVFGLHRHPAYWTEADRFQPERMLDRASFDPVRFAYLPFGAGPRSCIGARFSLYEMQIILTLFAREFTLAALDTRELEASPQITLKPSRPVRVRIRRQLKIT